jgi:hypothetical protein
MKDLTILFNSKKEEIAKITAYIAYLDASFANNLNRKSLEGFIFCLFSGLID